MGAIAEKTRVGRDPEIERAITRLESAYLRVSWVESRDGTWTDKEPGGNWHIMEGVLEEGHEAEGEFINVANERAGDTWAIIYRGKLLINVKSLLDEDDNPIRNVHIVDVADIPVLA